MTDLIGNVNILLILGGSAFFLLLSVSSYLEKEYRAFILALLFTAVNIILWTFFIRTAPDYTAVNITLFILTGLFGTVSLIQWFPGRLPERDTRNIEQYDERDNMFARNNIQHHPELMSRYYALHPEHKTTDEQIHAKPEFGESGQIYHDPYTAPFFEAAFEYLDRAIPLCDGSPVETPKPIDPAKFCEAVTGFAKFYGACDVSFLKLKPHHFYSRRGRHASRWGEETDPTYQTAITIVVPMRVAMLKQAPTSCALQESAQKYVEAAKISNILAGYIRSFGYRARAHNDANYDTLCVPIAVESGLGELGRMGLLIHKTYGPCVRLATVTTDLKLPDSTPGTPLFMEQFCRICKKCADNCPSGSITHGDEPSSRNVRHWSIQQEKCFSYWKTIGSDCGLCISVCPYTKPDTLIHRFVRFYISRNPVNQKIALLMDDLLYGRKKPIPKHNPSPVFKD